MPIKNKKIKMETKKRLKLLILQLVTKEEEEKALEERNLEEKIKRRSRNKKEQNWQNPQDNLEEDVE